MTMWFQNLVGAVCVFILGNTMNLSVLHTSFDSIVGKTGFFSLIKEKGKY